MKYVVGEEALLKRLAWVGGPESGTETWLV
jgi:hypothetical protein